MESAVIDPEAWDLTIVRAQGLRLMRPEKAWRPIVTVEIDEHNRHETTLGVDGQNPNLKQLFRFYDVKTTSLLEMKVWHRSQSKKKSKKRVLVASATHSLGDLLKKGEFEGTGKAAAKVRRFQVESEPTVLPGNLLDIRLSCQVPSKRCASSSSKGRPQNGAALTIKLAPPRTYNGSAKFSEDYQGGEPLLGRQAMDEVGYSSEEGTSMSSVHPAPSISSTSEPESQTLIDVQPPSPIEPTSRSWPSPPGLRKRRKRKQVRGFFSDDDPFSCTASEAESDCSSRSGSVSASVSANSSTTAFFGNPATALPIEDMSFESFSDIDSIMESNSPKIISLRPKASVETEKKTKTVVSTTTTETTERTSIRSWIAGSLLPQHVLAHKPTNASSDSLSKEEVPPYTETDITTVGEGGSAPAAPQSTTKPDTKVSSTTTKNAWWETFLGNFTFYLDLRDAEVDSQFEAILSNLRMEWTFMGGFLAALGAVDVAVLAIGDDSIIPVTPLSLRAIALSSTFTGLGLTALAYYILRYSLSPPHLFRIRAQDVYGSYVFFALSARVPTLCMVASALTLLGFLAMVAFEVWPVGVIVGCFLVGVLMSLQFLVYGCHMFVRGVIGAVRTVAGAVRKVVLRTAASAAGAPASGVVAPGGTTRSEGASRLRLKLAKQKVTRPVAGTSVC